MNRFALPLTFAAAFHAALLFGFSHRSRVAAIIKPAEPVTKPFEVSLEDPPPTEIVAADPLPKASSELLRPAIEESPHALPTARDFAITVIPHPAMHVGHPVINVPLGGGDANGSSGPRILAAMWLDDPPHARSQTPPVYPFDAKRVGLKGTVTVEFTVDETGRVLDPRVVDSTDCVFEQPTLQAVLKWRFEPGRKSGQIVRFRMAQPVVFRLDGDQ